MRIHVGISIIKWYIRMVVPVTICRVIKCYIRMVIPIIIWDIIMTRSIIYMKITLKRSRAKFWSIIRVASAI